MFSFIDSSLANLEAGQERGMTLGNDSFEIGTGSPVFLRICECSTNWARGAILFLLKKKKKRLTNLITSLMASSAKLHNFDCDANLLLHGMLGHFSSIFTKIVQMAASSFQYHKGVLFETERLCDRACIVSNTQEHGCLHIMCAQQTTKKMHGVYSLQWVLLTLHNSDTQESCSVNFQSDKPSTTRFW